MRFIRRRPSGSRRSPARRAHFRHPAGDSAPPQGSDASLSIALISQQTDIPKKTSANSNFTALFFRPQRAGNDIFRHYMKKAARAHQAQN